MSSTQETGSWGDLGEDNLPPVPTSPTSEAAASASGSGSSSVSPSGSSGSAGSRFPRHISREQFFFFQLLLHSCLSRSPVRRQVGLEVLAEDENVKSAMCLLAPFIYQTMCINIAGENLKYLVFIMRMISALLDNPNLNLDRYIHLMVPGPLGCLLADQITENPGAEDHWAVRMFASSIVSNIVHRYPCTKSTIIGGFAQALKAESLETVYGGIIGLGLMSDADIRENLLPQLKYLTERIEPYLQVDMEMSSVSLKTLAAKFISEELIEICMPILNGEEEEEEEEVHLTTYQIMAIADQCDREAL